MNVIGGDIVEVAANVGYLSDGLAGDWPRHRRQRRGVEGSAPALPDDTSTVQVDNNRVRVTRWDLAVGAQTGLHTHHHDYVVVPLRAGRMHVAASDGSVKTTELALGGSYYRTAGAEHNVSNDGDEVLSFVEVEIVNAKPSG